MPSTIPPWSLLLCISGTFVTPWLVHADETDLSSMPSLQSGDTRHASDVENLTFIAAQGLSVWPAEVRLSVGAPRQQLIVEGTEVASGDVNAIVPVFASEQPTIARVDARGVVHAVGEGNTFVRVAIGSATATVPVTVGALSGSAPIDFERDIQPVFARLGCNSGPCHGKQRGQNGFQLSLLGFDSDFDHDALTKEARSRRVFFAAPQQSLLLTKPTGQLPHGGGIRMQADGSEYDMLLRWVQSGAPRRQPDTPALTGVTIYPTERILNRGQQQQLAVTAHYNDGSTRDVTALATFQSNEEPIADVDEFGVVRAGTVVGEVAVMARYLGHFAIATVSVPLPGDVPPDYYASLPRHNFIDGHIWNALQRLGLQASDPAPEHKFVRRAYIDIIGRLPTVDEARVFLDNTDPNKRATLVDGLLDHPEYAEHWANKWADLLRPNPYRVGIKATLNYDAWIRDSFRRNESFDQFATGLIAARGSTFRNGNVTLFRDRRSPDEMTTLISQLFLGIRLECAKCHHHPFEVYGQDDFYSFAAYFAKVAHKGTGLSPPISGSEEFVYSGEKGEVRHPITQQVLEPRPLFGTAPDIAAGSDPREALAAWITSPDNTYFSRSMSNRIWTDLMGRGLVEPVDDLRATNPATNVALLDQLGAEFANYGFDLKQLIRTVTLSYVYGLSSLANDRNLVDTRNYSRHYRQRLRAEVLLDSVSRITGVPTTFSAMPPGAQARELWTHRIDSLFLDAFGRPDPNQDPPCERTTDPTIVQTLHLMNSKDLYRQVTDKTGRAAMLAASDLTPEQIVQELYLSIYSRYPDEDELKLAAGLYDNQDANRPTVTEDLMWALLNTPEFVFKD